MVTSKIRKEGKKVTLRASSKKKIVSGKKKTLSSKTISSKPSKEFDWTLEKIAHFIRERAYYLWEEVGKPIGQDLDIWIRAEKEILAQLIK